MADNDEDNGSLKPGAPRPLSAITPTVRASIQANRKPPSATTGLPSLDPELPSETGTPPSGRGVVVQPTDQDRRTARLFGLPEADAASLRPSLEALISWRLVSVTGADGQFEYSLPVDVEIRPGANLAELVGLQRRLETLCAPGGFDVARQELTMLRAMTVRRAAEDDDVTLIAVAYGEELQRYPVDVIQEACRAWRRANKFWPAWAELQNECDKRMRGRGDLLAAVKRGVRS